VTNMVQEGYGPVARFAVATWAALLLALVGVTLLSQEKQNRDVLPRDSGA
jgi:hypothetical protein